MNFTFTIHGEPKGKARHRSTKQGRMYNPQSAEDAAAIWEIRRQLALQVSDDYVPTTRPLRFEMMAVFSRPKSHFGTGRNAGKLKASAPEFHLKTSDLDNIVKRQLDLMNAIVYHDDCQVIHISNCHKRYGENPRICFAIIEE